MRRAETVKQSKEQHSGECQQSNTELRARRKAQLPQIFDAYEVRGGHQHNGGEHRLRQVVEKLREERKREGDGAGSYEQGKRRCCSPHVVDGGLRHAARDRKSLGEAGRQVGGAESCKLLFGIDVIAVLLREAASDGNSLSIGQHEACKRDWNKLRDIGNLDVRKPDLGHPDRQFPDYLDAFSPNPNTLIVPIAAMTTTSVVGRPGKARSNSMNNAMAARPMTSEGTWAAGRCRTT